MRLGWKHGARTFGDQGRPIGDWRGINHYQRRSHLTSSRGSIYTSCSLFPAFTITAQKHDASLLVPQLTIYRARKAHCRPHLQGLAATGAEVSKGPRGQAKGQASAPNHAVGIYSRQLNILSTSRHLLDESPSGSSSPATTLHDYLHNSPSLAFHPDNDFMKCPPANSALCQASPPSPWPAALLAALDSIRNPFGSN